MRWVPRRGRGLLEASQKALHEPGECGVVLRAMVSRGDHAVIDARLREGGGNPFILGVPAAGDHERRDARQHIGADAVAPRNVALCEPRGSGSTRAMARRAGQPSAAIMAGTAPIESANNTVGPRSECLSRTAWSWIDSLHEKANDTDSAPAVTRGHASRIVRRSLWMRTSAR